ncbi:isoamylase early set domain-containing protein [Ravibacter arvi]|uniref:Isoamylase early set domain-containing protein n=1 Tax=Ravibacter arvi TaxID=2051041 RepID=A0ABP8LU65_9BACT
MALSKQFIKSKSAYKVTFSVPVELVSGATEVTVLGEFNGWDPLEATKLKKQKDGSYKGALELAGGREYQFRYLLDGEKWINDQGADKYVSAGVAAEENSVLILA